MMASMNDVKGIIFDYGGTIDSRGVHWSEVIWKGYEKSGVNVDKAVFRDAYVYAERLLAKQPLVKPEYNFYDLMLLKVRNELLWLCEQGLVANDEVEPKSVEIAKYCDDSARECAEEAKPVLEALKERYPMVMVSNFYGNLKSVLEEYGLLKYFDSIVESAVVGVRKPDGMIFKLGVKELGMNPEQVVVIGDSYSKDIVPAMSIGCQTIWLKGKGWGDEPENDYASVEVKKLAEIPDALL